MSTSQASPIGNSEKYERNARNRGPVGRLVAEIAGLRHSGCRRYWTYRLTGRKFEEFYARRMDHIAEKNPENATGTPDQKRFQLEYLAGQGMSPQATLLDYGCGAGSAAVNFVGYLDTRKYVGADISAKCLQVARDRMRKANLLDRKPEFLLLEGGSTDCLAGRRFDFIWAQSVFTHMPPANIQALLAEIVPLLHPESKFYSTYAHTDGKPLHHRHVDWYYNEQFFQESVSQLPLRCTIMDDWRHPASAIDRMACFQLT